jgi:8-oxo-dGTP pyrophosphatase MutT (NUDIX family)
MSKPLSAGFVIRSKGKYLICHATQSPVFKMDSVHWTISKGMVENGEKLIDAAIRELKEETNIDLRNDVSIDGLDSLEPIQHLNLKKKVVYVFFIDDPEGELMDIELKCDSLIDIETHRLYGYPEMDAYMWVNKSTAKSHVFDSQATIFDNVVFE